MNLLRECEYCMRCFVISSPYQTCCEKCFDMSMDGTNDEAKEGGVIDEPA